MLNHTGVVCLLPFTPAVVEVKVRIWDLISVFSSEWYKQYLFHVSISLFNASYKYETKIVDNLQL